MQCLRCSCQMSPEQNNLNYASQYFCVIVLHLPSFLPPCPIPQPTSFPPKPATLLSQTTLPPPQPTPPHPQSHAIQPAAQQPLPSLGSTYLEPPPAPSQAQHALGFSLPDFIMGLVMLALKYRNLLLTGCSLQESLLQCLPELLTFFISLTQLILFSPPISYSGMPGPCTGNLQSLKPHCLPIHLQLLVSVRRDSLMHFPLPSPTILLTEWTGGQMEQEAACYCLSTNPSLLAFSLSFPSTGQTRVLGDDYYLFRSS